MQYVIYDVWCKMCDVQDLIFFGKILIQGETKNTPSG